MAMAASASTFLSRPLPLLSSSFLSTHSILPRIASPPSKTFQPWVSSVLHQGQPPPPSSHPTAIESGPQVPFSDQIASPPPVASVFTDMNDSHLKFWTTHEGVKQIVRSNKGWLDEDGKENRMLLAQLLLVANMAKDRVEMHSNIGQQRDNWNKLFQSTLTMAAMTATVLSALDGQHKSLSMSVPAFALDAGVALMMSVINRFQPSQLAEEQRSASRLFKRLANDIEYTLQIPADLRQEAESYLAECRGRLFALDKAFPLPLTPNGLEKFPEQVDHPILSLQPDLSLPEIKVSTRQENGWNDEICEDLLNTADLLTNSDIKIYKDWAQEKLSMNRILAIAAPILAAGGAGLNLIDAFGSTNLGAFAAVSSVLAAFAAGISHDAQMGMIFEMYRFCAGYFADVDASIQRAVRVPVEDRENGLLFHQRVAYQLGQTGAQVPAVPPGSKTAAVLF